MLNLVDTKGPKMDDLISTEQLQAALDEPDLRVVDATAFLPDTGRDARAEFDAGHIPGAVFLDLAEFADVPDAKVFSSQVRTLGLTQTDRIVVYDGSPLHSAARAWWLLRMFGARHVALLDGGLAKWKAEGRALKSGAGAAVEGAFEARADDTSLACMADVMNPGEAQIVDARSATRFAGDEPEPRSGVFPGHMPGARNLPQGQLFASDGTWKRGEDLRAAFTTARVDLDKPMITTCGSGVTAAVLSFGAHLLGKNDVRLYDGSWAQWGADPSTPKMLGAA